MKYLVLVFMLSSCAVAEWDSGPEKPRRLTIQQKLLRCVKELMEFGEDADKASLACNRIYGRSCGKTKKVYR